MSAVTERIGLRLAGFALLLVATFGLAYGVGRAVGPVDDDPVPHDAPVVTTTHAPEHEGMGS